MTAPRTRSRRARKGVLAVLCIVVLVAPACSTDEERLTIYSGRTSDLIKPLLDQFSEETGTKIDVRYGDSADLALLIDEEGDRSEVDVFISQSPGDVGFLDEQGALRELDSSDRKSTRLNSRH